MYEAYRPISAAVKAGQSHGVTAYLAIGNSQIAVTLGRVTVKVRIKSADTKSQ